MFDHPKEFRKKIAAMQESSKIICLTATPCQRGHQNKHYEAVFAQEILNMKILSYHEDLLAMLAVPHFTPVTLETPTDIAKYINEKRLSYPILIYAVDEEKDHYT